MSYAWQNWETLVQPKDNEPVHNLGSRFNAEGTFLPEHGNTIVRHAIPDTKTHDALQELRSSMMALPYASHFAFTAPTSLHMTVFEGVIDNRRKDNFWPSSFPKDMALTDATQIMDECLAYYEGAGAFNISAVGLTPLGLALSGTTDDDTITSRAWRDTLVGPMGYRAPDHDSYTFHLTISYVMKWLPDEALALYRAELAKLFHAFCEQVPVLKLGPPAFCTFKDMNAFPPIRTLKGFE